MAQQLALFDYEQMPLGKLEEIIDRGLSTFIEVGMALLAIREGKKYREKNYTDFNVYIEERWGMSHVHGLRLLNAGYIATEIVEVVPMGTTFPTHERQVRPLCRLGTSIDPAPELWANAWIAACELAEGRVPTAREVEFVVTEMLYHEPEAIKEKDYGKYQVILADPPWQYQNSGFDEAAQSQYPTMPVEDICDLGESVVKLLINDSTVLFLWATNPLLLDALQVLQAWGFEYKTNIAWVKDKGRGKGWFLKSKHELLLIGVRNETPHPAILLDSAQLIKRPNRLSQKPTEFYELINQMYPHGNRIELFQRKPYPGWDGWGNEI